MNLLAHFTLDEIGTTLGVFAVGVMTGLILAWTIGRTWIGRK